MKRILLLVVLVTSSVFMYSCLSDKSNKDGIKFFEGTWAEALQKAKTEHKPIFLDIYASWCGPCKMLKKQTFTDKSVGDYFNANYVCVSVDGEKGEGPMLASKFSITAYPTLIVVNKDGNLVNLQAGFMEPSDLIDYGKASYRN